MHPERTTISTVARRAAGWAVLAVAALVVLKLVAGFVQTLFTMALLVALAVGVVWALRRI